MSIEDKNTIGPLTELSQQIVNVAYDKNSNGYQSAERGVGRIAFNLARKDQIPKSDYLIIMTHIDRIRWSKTENSPQAMVPDKETGQLLLEHTEDASDVFDINALSNPAAVKLKQMIDNSNLDNPAIKGLAERLLRASLDSDQITPIDFDILIGYLKTAKGFNDSHTGYKDHLQRAAGE
jgi:hypothetical protein